MDFFASRMDYISFFYGLSFFLLGVICLMMIKGKNGVLPWAWLGLFGFTHALYKFLDIFSIGFGDTWSFKATRIIVVLTSFLALSEFGRKGLIAFRKWAPGLFIYIPLIAITLTGGLAGLEGVNAVMRYSVIPVGGVMAIRSFYLAAETINRASKWLLSGGTFLGLFVLSVMIVPPYAPFVPASILNNNSFFETIGFPIHLLRGILALLAGFSIWTYSRTHASSPLSGSKPTFIFEPAVIIFTVILAGFGLTEFAGHQGKKEVVREGDLMVSALAVYLNDKLEAARHLLIERSHNPIVTAALANPEPASIRMAESQLNDCKYDHDFLVPSCYMLGRDGTILTSCANANTSVIRKALNLDQTKSSGHHLNGHYFDRISGERVFYLKSPVLNRSGGTIGFVMVTPDLKKIESTFGKYRFCFLVDPGGTIFLSSSKDLLLRKLWDKELSGHLRGDLDKNTGPVLEREVRTGEFSTLNGETFISIRHYVGEEGWSLVLLNPATHIEAYRLFAIIVTFSVCGLICSFFATLFFRIETASGLEQIVKERTAELSDLNEVLTKEVSERRNAEKALIEREERIETSLKEKEVLLKEIHHRVKNNLQVISSLLSLQADYTADRRVKEMFLDSRNRVRTMGLIHEKLYGSGDVSKIDLRCYISDLIGNLVASYGPTGIRSRICVDELNIDVDRAIPVGLIVNELVSNALKYAFPADKKGEVRIELRPAGTTGDIELIVADNGIGIPMITAEGNTGSLGLNLVLTLVEKQLRGSVEMKNNGGTEFKIRFRGAG